MFLNNNRWAGNDQKDKGDKCIKVRKDRRRGEGDEMSQGDKWDNGTNGSRRQIGQGSKSDKGTNMTMEQSGKMGQGN